MADHPIESLMVTAMTSLRDMIDVNTIIGDVVQSADGTIIIPVSKVTFGFASGGSEFNTNKLNKFSESVKLPFGGGSGAGVNISPSAFLVVKDGNIKVLNLNASSAVEKIIDLAPDAMDKVSLLIGNCINKKSETEVEKADKELESIKNKIEK
ncbi:MAG: GerW family sporulation protein [Clostridia bacterium]